MNVRKLSGSLVTWALASNPDTHSDTGIRKRWWSLNGVVRTTAFRSYGAAQTIGGLCLDAIELFRRAESRNSGDATNPVTARFYARFASRRIPSAIHIRNCVW